MFKFQKLFASCKWVIMYMTYEQSYGLWYKKLKLKLVIIFEHDLKFWSFFKTKCRIWQNLYILKTSYLFKKS
jgi:hypothetical protein